MRRLALLVVFASLMVVAGAAAQAGANPVVGGVAANDACQPARPVVTVPDLGPAYDVAMVGHNALVPAGEAGLAVVDLLDPTDPQLVTTLALGFPAEHIAIVPGRAYPVGPLLPGAAGAGMFSVAGVDLTDPGSLRLQQTVSAQGTASDVDAEGQVVYVAGGQGGVAAMTLGGGGPLDRMDVIESGSLTPTDVLVDSHMLYIVESYPAGPGEALRARLRVLDVSALPDVSVLGALDFDSQPESRGLALAGDRLLVPASRVPITEGMTAEQKEDLLVVDVSDPTRLRALGFLALDGYAKDVVVSGDTAYVAAGRDASGTTPQEGASLIVLTGIFDPGGPRAPWVAQLPAVPRGLALDGDYALVAMGEAGLALVEVPPEVISPPTQTPTGTASPTETPPGTSSPQPTDTAEATPPASPTPSGGGRLWLPAAARGAVRP